MIENPCQIVRSGRRLVYRLLSWNPWQGVFLRLVERLEMAAGCTESRQLEAGVWMPRSV